MALSNTKRTTRKPQPWPIIPARTAASWAWRNAVWAVPFQRGSRELVTNTALTFRNGLGWRTSRRGWTPAYSGVGNQWVSLGNIYSYDPTNSWTVWAFIKYDNTINQSIVAKFHPTSDLRVFNWQTNASGGVTLNWGAGAGVDLGNGSMVHGQWYLVALRNVAPGGSSSLTAVIVSASGNLLASGVVGHGTAAVDYSAEVGIGGHQRDFSSFVGDIAASMTVERWMRNDELVLLARDPFAPFRPRPVRVQVPLDLRQHEQVKSVPFVRKSRKLFKPQLALDPAQSEAPWAWRKALWWAGLRGPGDRAMPYGVPLAVDPDNTNIVEWSRSRFGPCLTYSGTTSPAHARLNIGRPVSAAEGTILALFTPSAALDLWTPAVRNNTTGHATLYLRTDTEFVAVQWATPGETFRSTVPGALTLGKTYLVVASVRDAVAEITKLTLDRSEYFEGDVAVGAGSQSLSGDWDIGWHPFATTRNFHGDMHYAAVFSRAWAREEVLRLAADPFAPFQLRQRLFLPAQVKAPVRKIVRV